VGSCGGSNIARFEDGYTGLDRPPGHADSSENQVIIESARKASTGRGQVAAAMFVAMMSGDVEAVKAALSQLGILLSPQSMTSRLT